MRMYMFLGRPVYYVDMSGLVRRHYTFKLECIKKKYTSPRTVVSNVRPAEDFNPAREQLLKGYIFLDMDFNVQKIIKINESDNIFFCSYSKCTIKSRK